MSDFLKGLVFTAVPIVALCIIGSLGSIRKLHWAAISWLAAATVFLAAFVTAIVMGVLGKRKISAGIFVGLAIGVIALGASCFALSVSSLAG